MKKDYSRSIRLRCIVCAEDMRFEPLGTKQIRCMRCGKIYHGGEDELRQLNVELINHHLEEITDEVTKDLQKEINQMLKNIFK